MRKIRLITTFLIFTGFLTVISTVNAQSPKTTKSTKAFDKITNEDGWNIPFIKKFVRGKGILEDLSGTTITISGFKPTLKTGVVLLEFYGLTSENNLVFKKNKILIEGITFYSIDDKIFGVKIDYSYYRQYGYSSALVFTYFSDEDGDGKLETQYSQRLSLQVPKVLPEWVKEKAKKTGNKLKN